MCELSNLATQSWFPDGLYLIVAEPHGENGSLALSPVTYTFPDASVVIALA
jgi:hypothetical protein